MRGKPSAHPDPYSIPKLHTPSPELSSFHTAGHQALVFNPSTLAALLCCTAELQCLLNFALSNRLIFLLVQSTAGPGEASALALPEELWGRILAVLDDEYR